MEVKNIVRNLTVIENKIHFCYNTKKGFYKEQIRTIKAINNEDPKELFKNWVKEQRTIFNAKILSIVQLNSIEIKL